MHCGLLGGSCDVPGDPTALGAPQGHLRAWRRWNVVGVALDLARTRRTTEGRAGSILGDKVQSLRWVERRLARLAHKKTSNLATVRLVPERRLMGAGSPVIRGLASAAEVTGYPC